jgi:hypothetical protein
VSTPAVDNLSTDYAPTGPDSNGHVVRWSGNGLDRGSLSGARIFNCRTNPAAMPDRDSNRQAAVRSTA